MGRKSRRTSTRGGGGKGGAEEEEGKEEYDNMVVVVAGGGHTNPGSLFLLGRGENDGSTESRCCDAIFGPGNRITDAAVKFLHLIRDNRGWGRQLFTYDL